jgi:hypothetical protein
MQRIALLTAAFFLTACSSRSPWAGGSAKAPVPTPEDAKPAVEAVANAEAPVAAPAPAEANEAAPAPVAPTLGRKYSWQAKSAEVPTDAGVAVAKPATGAPNDETKARILAVRLDQGLIAFIRKEKPDAGTFLQLTKADKALLVRVIRSDDNSSIADIIAGQDPAKTPVFELNEEVLCGTPSDLPQ